MRSIRLKERDVERYLALSVKKLGGSIRKLKWIGRTGAPDRLVLLNDHYFVELKRPGGKLRAAQVREIEILKRNGCNVFVIDSLDKVDDFCSICSKRIPDNCQELDH